MNSLKGKSAMLMTKGIMDLRTDPPRLVCTILTFRHPETHKEVTLYPIPNIAAPAYFRRALDADALTSRFDKILCEDGRLPLKAGTYHAQKQLFMQRIFPFFSLRPVTADGSKFDGMIARDAIESRMAYQSVLNGMEPPVDPRARRGVERIDTYAEGMKVVVPWGVYHMPYFRDRLLREGFTQTNTEEIEVFGFRQVLAVALVFAAISFLFTLMIFSLFMM